MFADSAWDLAVRTVFISMDLSTLPRLCSPSGFPVALNLLRQTNGITTPPKRTDDTVLPLPQVSDSSNRGFQVVGWGRVLCVVAVASPSVPVVRDTVFIWFT